MKTVDDFLRADAALQVTCNNCDHTAPVSARFLKARVGAHVRVADISFQCGKCKLYRVTVKAAPASTAVNKLAEGMHFGGIYEKFEAEDG